MQITITPGLLVDSAVLSFLDSLDGALSKFDQEVMCPIELETTIIVDAQDEMETEVKEELNRARQLEVDLMNGGINKPQLVKG